MTDALVGAARVTACSDGEQIIELLEGELVKQARGEPIDSEACEYAMTALAAAQFVNAGVDIAVVERMFLDRPHKFHLEYDFDSEDLSIRVVWTDVHAEDCTNLGDCDADEDGVFACHGGQ